MRARFPFSALWLLLLLLLIPLSRLRAQGRPVGPWRVVVKKVREKYDWGIAKADTTVHLVSEVTVVAPRWDVEPDSILLFLNCENPFIAPASPRKGRPAIRFTATGAAIQLNTKTKRLLIAPSASVVTLWAYRGSALVFKHVFKAIPPPAPTLECYYGGQQPTDLKPGEKWQRSLILKAIPDAQFSAFLPDDARYRVSLYQVTFLRNNKPIQPTKTIKGPQSEIGNPQDYRSGDQLRVQVQAVQRMNFRGNIEVLPLHKQFVLPVQFIEY